MGRDCGGSAVLIIALIRLIYILLEDTTYFSTWYTFLVSPVHGGHWYN